MHDPKKQFRKINAAARRKITIREGGLPAWRGRAIRFKNRKRELDRKCCRGKVKDE